MWIPQTAWFLRKRLRTPQNCLFLVFVCGIQNSKKYHITNHHESQYQPRSIQQNRSISAKYSGFVVDTNYTFKEMIEKSKKIFKISIYVSLHNQYNLYHIRETHIYEFLKKMVEELQKMTK